MNIWNAGLIPNLIVPRFRESVGTLNLIRPSVRPSVCLSVCHKNFNLGHNFCTITDRALILGMCVPCDKTFPVVPCRDLDGDLWPSSRSNLLPSGGPQFSEFACLNFTVLWDGLDRHKKEAWSAKITEWRSIGRPCFLESNTSRQMLVFLRFFILCLTPLMWT